MKQKRKAERRKLKLLFVVNNENCKPFKLEVQLLKIADFVKTVHFQRRLNFSHESCSHFKVKGSTPPNDLGKVTVV